MGELGVVVAGREHLALLGHADAAVAERHGLGEDGLGRRAAPARNGAAAPMEKRHPHAVFLTDPGDGRLSLKERPVGGKVAAVLVGIGIAQHHMLVSGLGGEDGGVSRVRE